MAALSFMALGACNPDLGSSIRGWSPAAASEGVVYAATQQGKLKALIDDGSGVVSVKWTFPAGEEQLGGVFNTPVVGAELVYVAAADGNLYAIDKETGTIGSRGWTSPLVQDPDHQHLVSGPVLDAGENTILVGSDDRHLYAIDASSGAVKWKFMSGDKVWSTPAIADETVYFGSHDRNIYALDLATGDLKWQFPTGGAVVGRPLVWRDMVLIGSFDRKLYALDANQGNELWSFEGASNWIWSGAVASDSFVFAPSLDGHVYALDAAGNLQWDYDAGSPLVADPVIVPRGLVVASSPPRKSTPARIIVLNTATGDEIFSALDVAGSKIKAPLFTMPPNAARPGQPGISAAGDETLESVFVGATDGSVRRVQIRTARTLIWCFDTREETPCN
jgi:outer membrane protein assembly factor BamB